MTVAVWRTTVQTDYPAVGGPGYSTFHYRDDADGGLEDALQGATDALIAAYTALAPTLPAAVLMGTEGRWVDVADDRIVDVDGASVRGGITQVQDPLPPATTLCVSWGTTTAARSGRGRTFLSGFGEPASTDGAPTAACLAAARAMGASLVNFNGTVGNGAFVVYSRATGVSRDITRSAVRPIWAVLRSRRD